MIFAISVGGLLRGKVTCAPAAGHRFEPAGDRPSNLVGTDLLHEVETFDDPVLLLGKLLASLLIRPVMNTPGSASIKSFGSDAVFSHAE